MFAPQIAGLLLLNPGMVFLVLLSGLAFLLCTLTRRRRGSARLRRHRRYQTTAARVLDRLPQLAGEGQRLSYSRRINPYVFEELLLLAFSRQGLRVVHNAAYSGDGGCDGQVWIAGQRYLVQAKRYRRSITPVHVLEFAQLLARENCAGLFIHTGRTGEKSRQHSRVSGAPHIISGRRLLALLAGQPDWMPHKGETR